MVQLTSGIIYGLFFMFLLFGTLLGLKRGLIKSTIRIISVILSCVIVVFIVPSISSALLTTDLSSSGLTIGDIPLTTIKDTIIAYVSQLLGVGSLLSSSPTLVAFICSIPQILINLILFILFFFVVKGVFYIADIFINKIFIKKDSNKPIRRIWGAVVGGVQGILCFLFFMIPIAGSMNLITETLNITKQSSSQQTAVVALANEGDSSPSNSEALADNLTQNAFSTIDSYNDIFIIKTFNAIGYDNLTNAIFDKLTSIEINSSTSTTIRTELKIIAKISTNAEKLKNVDIAKFSEENQTVANEIIDDAFSSPLIGGIATEIIGGVADAWAGTNSSDFMGMAKPDIDSNLLSSFDALLLNLRTNTVDDTKTDLKVIVSTLKVSADYDITSSINTGNTDLIVEALGKDKAMEDLIATLATGNATKQILPSFIKFGITYGYSAIGAEESTTIVTKTADEVNWETESIVLGNFFEGVSTVYQSSKGTEPILNRIDLNAFAKILEALRDSELLQGASQDITIHLLSSNILNGVDCTTFISYVENDTTYKNLDFVSMFATLKSSTEIANDIKDITSGSGDTTNLDSSSVGTLIDGLTGNNTTKEVIKELASEENLKNSGVDAATAGAVNALIESVADYDTTTDNSIQPPQSTEEKEHATNAIQDLLIASKNAKTENPDQQIFETKESMEQFIDNMLSSPFVWAATINNGEILGFKTASKTNLSETEEGWLNQILAQKISDEECTNSQANELRLMFYPIV